MKSAWHAVVDLLPLAALAALGLVLCSTFRREGGNSSDAYILVKGDVAAAQWNYQQLPMHDCAWCGRTVNLNRHHIVPQAANPALRDVRGNLIVLCRDCHFVLGHRCDWKRYNPDVLYICTHFTNVVRSADKRREVQSRPADPPPAAEPGGPETHATNDVERQKTLERILGWTPTNSSQDARSN